MAVAKIDPKVIFASEAPAQDTPAVFTNKTVGWGESRKNGGRPTIKQSNALQQETDLKILWLNENSVTPFDATIDYPENAVTIKDDAFKILKLGVWELFLDKSSVGLGNVDNTSDLNKPVSTSAQTALNLKADKSTTYTKVEVDNALDLLKPPYLSSDVVDGNQTQDQINLFGGKKYDMPVGGYPLNARVLLDNGDIVKNTIPNNTNDPNVDMTGWVNPEEKQKLKNSEFVTVQDFMLMKDIEDCKQPIPQYDHSYAILAFFAYIQNNKVVKADFSGNLNLSEPLVLTNPATDAINFNAKIFAISSGGDAVTFNQCNHVRPSGKFMVTTEATVFSGKKWNRGVVFQSSSAMQCSWYLRASGFKHWNIDLGDAGNNNSISLGTVRTQYGGSGTSQRSLIGVTQVNTTVSTFTYTQDLNNENYVNAGFIVAGGIYYPVISHDPIAKTIVSTLLPSIFTTVQVIGFHVSRNFTARIDNPMSATPTQRSIITLNQGVDLPPQFERSDYVVIDDEPYRIFGYNPNTLELSIYPRIKDYSKTSGMVHFSFGGGVRLNGSDTNLVSIGKLSLTGNAIGVSNNNFYCTSIENAGAEFNIIGIGMGVTTTGVTKNNSSRNFYFEGNIFNVVDASADTGVNVIENPIAWEFNKFKRLVPLGSTANPVAIYSKTGVVVVEDGVTYRKQLGFYDGTNSATSVLSLGVQDIQNVRGSTNTVVLADNKSKRNLYGYTDIFFNVTGIRNNGTSDGATITIRSQDGYTINGVTGDFVMYGARNALLVHAKLVSGSNWQVSVFKASYMPVVKTLTIPSIAANAGYTITTTLANAQMGDSVKVAANIDLQGMLLTANVSTIGNIRISLYNPTSVAINLGSVNFECSLER